MTDLRNGGVLLILQQIAIVALIPQVYVFIDWISKQSIDRTGVIKTGENK